MAKVTDDREHIVEMSAHEVGRLRQWLNGGLSGSHTFGRVSFNAVEGGGILVRTRPYSVRADADSVYLSSQPLDPEDIDPEAVKRAVKVTALAHDFAASPLLKTNVCPSRFFDSEGQQIRHCDGDLGCVGPDVLLPRRHHNGSFGWSDEGAMPAERPCDKRCARCVERERDNMIKRAVEWRDQATPVTEGTLMGAIDAYRKVMGL